MKSARFPLGRFPDQDVYNSLSHLLYNFMFIDSINLPDKRSGATLILFALQFYIFACVYTDTYNIQRYINNNIWHLHSLSVDESKSREDVI